MPDINRLAAAPSDNFAVTSVANNTNCVATLAATAGWQWFVTGYTISVAAAPSATVSAVLKDGTGGTVIEQLEIPAAVIAPIVVNFTRPMQLTAGNAAELTIPAVGGTTRATATLRGFKAKAA